MCSSVPLLKIPYSFKQTKDQDPNGYAAELSQRRIGKQGNCLVTALSCSTTHSGTGGHSTSKSGRLVMRTKVLRIWSR